MASFDFYTPNREALKLNIGLTLDSNRGKILVSSGAPFTSHPYIKTLGLREWP